MKVSSFSKILMSFFVLSSGSVSVGAAEPGIKTDRIMEVDDFKQTNPKAGFEDGGSNYCAPTSLSDCLMYLSKHGYPSLVAKGADAESTQIGLIKALASADYLNTNPLKGTDPSQIANGLEKYITAHGCKVKRLEYQGWRPCAAKYSNGVAVPKLDWLKTGCSDRSFALINYGWYQYDENTDTYKRTGGHWVALVGYGKDGSGQKNPDAIIVHDPIPRFSADSIVPVYVSLNKIESGMLTGDFKGLPQKADGYYYFDSYSNGERTKEMKNYGIVDCAIVAELE